MKIGIIKTSLKENEKRLPIHPDHIKYIDPKVRKSLYFENNYGTEFMMSDTEILNLGACMLTRDEILHESDLVVLPKPMSDDLKRAKKGAIVWGWMHCVQQTDIAQHAIDNNLTYVSWEAMHTWVNNTKNMHIFYRNNELAGYASVIHSLQLLGMDGLYGERKKVVIFGYGSVSKGAITALHGRGFNNITVLSKREFHLIADKNPDVYFKSYSMQGQKLMVNDLTGKEYLIDYLRDADIIINGILQNVKSPVTFIQYKDVGNLKPGCLIIDISCDKGMGFEFARPTSFIEPIIEIEHLHYYSVDHTPSYLWRAATREISLCVLPFLKDISEGLSGIEQNEILAKAVEMKNGIIVNDDIISFQNRLSNPPYQIKC